MIVRFATLVATVTTLICSFAEAQPMPLRAPASATDDVALARLWKKAEGGDAEAQFALAVILDSGAKQDLEQAALWLRRAAAQGHPGAEFAFANSLFEGRGQAEDHVAANIWYRKAGEHGVAQALYRLGENIVNSDGVPERDDSEALKLFTQAAELGDAGGQYRLGQSLIHGRGPDDGPRAIRWLRRSAAQGNPDGQYALATELIKGKLVPTDVRYAVQLLTKAAANGLPHAQATLARMYAKGDGVAVDEREALRLMTLAASSPYPFYLRELGDMYQFTTTIPPNYGEAEKWYVKAAEAEQDTAVLRLAQLYDSDKTGLRDVAKATAFYRKAADWTNWSARIVVGKWFLAGDGVEQSDRAAYYWFELVRIANAELGPGISNPANVTAGQDAERLLAQLAKRMPQGEIARAKKAAADCHCSFHVINLQRALAPAELEWKRLNIEAVAAYKAHRFKEARLKGAEALKLAEQRQGGKSARLIVSLANMEWFAAAQGRYDDAVTFNLRALKLQESALGGTHTDAIATMQRLVAWYKETGQTAEAQLYEARIRAAGSKL